METIPNNYLTQYPDWLSSYTGQGGYLVKVKSDLSGMESFNPSADWLTQYLLADGSRPMTGNLNMDSNFIYNLSDPVSPQQAATAQFVLDNIFSGSHGDLGGVTSDQHHAQLHGIVTHDTSATGIELDTLTDGSNADLLHVHAGGGSVTGPPDTKGDLWSYDTDTNNFPVGTDGYPLVPASGETFGLKYGTNTLNLGDPASTADTTINFLGSGPIAWNDYSGWIKWDTSAAEIQTQNKLKIDGDISSGSKIWFAPYYVGLRFSIDSITASTKTFTITGEGDLTPIYSTGTEVEVLGTTAGFFDGLYTVASSSYSDPVTSVVVNETVAFDWGAGGTIGLSKVSLPANGAFLGRVSFRNPNGTGGVLSGYAGIDGTNITSATTAYGLQFGVTGLTVSGTDGDATNLNTSGMRIYEAGVLNGTFNFNIAKGIDIIHLFPTAFNGTINGTTAIGLNIENFEKAGTTINLDNLYQVNIKEPTEATNNYQCVLEGNGSANTGIYFDGITGEHLYSDGINLVSASPFKGLGGFVGSAGGVGITNTIAVAGITNLLVENGLIIGTS